MGYTSNGTLHPDGMIWYLLENYLYFTFTYKKELISLTLIAVRSREAWQTGASTSVMVTSGVVPTAAPLATVGTVGPWRAPVLAGGTSVARGAHTGTRITVTGASVVAQTRVLTTVAPAV